MVLFGFHGGHPQRVYCARNCCAATFCYQRLERLVRSWLSPVAAEGSACGVDSDSSPDGAVGEQSSTLVVLRVLPATTPTISVKPA